MTNNDADVSGPTDAFKALIKIVKVGDIVSLRRTKDRREHMVKISQASPAGILIESPDGTEWVAGWEVEAWKVPTPRHDDTAATQHAQAPAHDPTTRSARPIPPDTAQPTDEPLPSEQQIADAAAKYRSEFSAEPVLDHPEPSFAVDYLSFTTRQEINRWRQRYHFACNAREPARLAVHVSEIEELAKSLSDPRLFCLAGAFAHLSGSGSARAASLYEASAARGWRPACIALASIRLAAQDFFGAAQALMSALLTDTSAQDNARHLLVMGQCLFRSHLSVLRGLGDFIERTDNDPVRQLAARLAATMLESDATAFSAAIRIDTRALRATTTGSQLFTHAPAVRPTGAEESNNHSSQNTGSVPRMGKVSAFYPGRGFGFLVDDTAGDTWFFHTKEVLDEGLIESLHRGHVRQVIAFEGEPTILTGKYPAARRVRSVASTDTPISERASRAPLSVRLAVLPKDNSFYSKAKHAEQLDQLDTAEENFRQEIAIRGTYFKSAIKDLAMLLNRQGHSDAAIDLLSQHRSQFSPQEMPSLDHLAVICLVKARRFTDAAERLNSLARTEIRETRRLDLKRQEAYWLFAAGQLDKALDKLHAVARDYPKDTATLLLIDKVTQAKSSGQLPVDTAHLAEEVAEGDEALTILALGLSPLARRHLDTCSFRGVDQRARESAQFTELDFTQVDRLHKQLVGRRPRERADYCLTLAALCERKPDIAGDRSLHVYLRHHFVAVTEAAMSAHSHPDVVRCYATEALALSPEKPSSKTPTSLSDALVLLLGTYLTPRVEPSELLAAQPSRRLRDLLRRFVKQRDCWLDFVRDAVYYYSMSPSAMSLLNDALTSRDERFEGLEAPCVNDDIALERDRRRNDALLLRRMFDSSIPLSADRLRGNCEAIAGLSETTRFALDSDRLSHLVHLCGDGADYVLERHFRERENRILRLEAALTSEIDEYNEFPTQLSVEVLVPALTAFRDALKEDFKRTQATPPDLRLSNVLTNDYYVINDGSVELRLLLTSHDERAPAIESISLLSDRSDPCHSPDPLHGGDSRELALVIHPTPEQIADEAFTVEVDITFRVRGGDEQTVRAPALAVRLGGTEFQQISNPYAEYAGGVPIRDERMFFGRTELIQRIKTQLTNGEAGQCYVLYGQKRSGKSSVLKRVEQQLPQHVVYLSLSAGELQPLDLLGSFARHVVQRLEMWNDDHLQAIAVPLPSRNDAQSQPVEVLNDVSRLLRRQRLRLVIAVDEFTYLYDQATDDAESTARFMRGWKALLEANAFGALVIGQDTMPRFKERFANEFGVTHDERISYLAPDEARSLASEPILLDGSSRYRGKSIDRLYQLTAGSPFFLQIMCDRLVRHLNLRRASFVTEADVDQVARELCIGNDKLTVERFDALVTAASEKVAPVPHEVLWVMVERVARESLHAGWCYRESLKDLPHHHDGIKDLVDREILSAEGDRVRLRVGLFAMWLRLNRQ